MEGYLKMMLRWIEIDETGNEIVRNNYPVTVENACTYARKNHRICHGRGVQHYDNGYQYVYEMDENLERPIMVRKQINPRIIACDCVIKHIERFGY